MQIDFVRVVSTGRPILPLAAVPALLAALLLAIGGATPVVAQDPLDQYSGTAPGPIGVTKGRLTSLIVDAALQERRGHTYASVQAAFHVQNSDPAASQPITLSFPSSLSNGMAFDPDAFESFQASVDGKERELSAPRHGEAITATAAYSLVLTVEPEESTVLRILYQQDLGEVDIPAFQFAVGAASLWPGPVSSYRATVRFPEATSLEQVLEMRPNDPGFDGQNVTWYYTDVEPKTDIVLTFVKPSLWDELRDARLEVTEQPESAEAHYRLASLYRRLASRKLASGVDATFRGLLIAELEAARRVASPVDELLCAVHRELAEFSRERTRGPDGSLQPLHLSTLIDELERARDSCPQDEWDPALDAEIANGYLQLARVSRLEGRFQGALQQLDASAKSRNQSDSAQELAAERRLTYLGWVSALLDRGENDRALELAAEGLRPDDLIVGTDLRPRFGSVQVAIVTEAAGHVSRRINVRLQHYLAWPSAVDDALGEIRAGLPSELSTATVLTGARATELQIELTAGRVNELPGLQRSIVETLPDWPELAPVRAALSASRIESADEEHIFSRESRYSEAIDLSEADSVLRARQTKVEEERQRLEAEPSATGDEAQLLREVRRKVAALVEESWARFREDSRVSFETAWTPPGGDSVRRGWALQLGQAQDMRVEARTLKWSSILTAAGLGAILVLVVVFVLLLVAKLSR